MKAEVVFERSGDVALKSSDAEALLCIWLIKYLAPATPVLMLTTLFDYRLKKEAPPAGAADFLLKQNLPAQIIAAVLVAAARFGSLCALMSSRFNSLVECYYVLRRFSRTWIRCFDRIKTTASCGRQSRIS